MRALLKHGLPIALGLTVFTRASLADPAATTKLAIVEVGTKTGGPMTFVDFLTVALSRESTIELLEREKVEQLLREQALGLALSGADAVKAGKLAGADAFLMLEANDKQALRVRLVDARYGLKLWDTMFVVDTNSRALDERARMLAKGTVFRLANFMCATNTPRTVSISAFHSEEMSKRWDWLGEMLATGVEQQLALQPGIVVMERARTQPLTDERELVEGLPEALRASAMIVDGAYKIDRAQGTNTIVVTLRCRRNNVTTLKTTVTGSMTNLTGLQQTVVGIVASNVGKKADCGSMDPAAEAKMLAAEASGMLVHEPQRALSLAGAALALEPDNIDYDALVLKAYARWLGNGPDEFIANSLRGLAVLESVVRRTGGFPEDAYFFLNGVSSGLINRQEIAHADGSEDVQELRREFWRTLWVCHKTLKSNRSSNLFDLLECVSGACRLCVSTSQAIEYARLSLWECVEMFESQHPALLYSPLDAGGSDGLVGAFCLPKSATWPSEPDADDRMTAFLDELCHSDDVLVRMLAERASMRFYGDWSWQTKECGTVNFEEARQHARAYVLCVGEAQQAYPYLGEDYRSALNSVTFAATEKDNQQFRDQLALVLDPKPSPTETNRAVVYETCRIVSLQDGLKKQLQIPSASYRDLHFRRIVYHDNVAAIVYTQGPTVDERCGVVWLDPISFEPLASASSTVVLPSEGSGRYVSPGYEQYGASVASVGAKIFVGFPQTGILAFARDGKVEWFNESSGLADQSILALDALDGKLYALVGTPFARDKETGMMELDPATRVSRILISSRAKFKNTDIDQREILSIAADQRRHALWVLTPGELFFYRPVNQFATNRTSVVSPFFKAVRTFASNFLSLEMCGDNLLLVGWGGCFLLDTQTEQLEPLVTGREGPEDAGTGMKSRWPQQGFWPVLARHPILVADSLIVREDWSNAALIFRDGESKSDGLLRLCFPQEVGSRLTVRDLASSPRGLLILTDDSLYLVPGLRDQPQAEAGQQSSPPGTAAKD